jgi:hypothetical protein
MARPNIEPTDEQRQLVKSLSAFGISQEHIARRLRIRSLKTLRKHYREELDEGVVDANCSVAKTLYKMATSGRHPTASMFWLASRAGWKVHSVHEPQAVAPPHFIVTKDTA